MDALLANYSNPGLVAQNLTPYTDYVFKVRAFNHEGPGNYSKEIHFQTEEEGRPTARRANIQICEQRTSTPRIIHTLFRDLKCVEQNSRE